MDNDAQMCVCDLLNLIMISDESHTNTIVQYFTDQTFIQYHW